MKRTNYTSDNVAKVLLAASILSAAWAYGVVSYRFEWFPYPQLRSVIANATAAVTSLRQSSDLSLPWWYAVAPDDVERARTYQPDAVSPGLLLVSGMGQDDELMARIISRDGNTIHEWELGWFDLWPDPSHLPEDAIPKSKPGAAIDGIAWMPNGDIVFNYDLLGLIRVDYCGKVVWRLPYRTHHSVVVSDNGSLWVPGRITRNTPSADAPNYEPPYEDFTLLEISPEGEILREISVFDLLWKNGLQGLLYMSTIDNWQTTVSGDTLHLNDIDLFPSSLAPGFFGPGDIMISLRNINTILVFDQVTQVIKFASVGAVVRQHDPDFKDGNTISVFDNNNLSASPGSERADHAAQRSRIAIIPVSTGKVSTFFEGSPAAPFFSDIMGRHEWLENGNLLITEARSGHVLEVDPRGRLVWEYFNLVDDDKVGLIDTATRLPSDVDIESLSALNASCEL